MAIIFGVDAGNLASSGFPPHLQARIIASMCKVHARPLDPDVLAEAAALGADMARWQGEHRAHAAMKQVHARPGHIDLARLAKDAAHEPLSGSVAAPLTGGAPDAGDPDLAHVRLMAPDWIPIGSRWEMPSVSASGWTAGEKRPPLVVVVGPDRTATVLTSYAIWLLATWASARAEPGDAGAGYRVKDSIADASAAAAGVLVQDDSRRRGGDQGTNTQDDRPGARSPSSEDRRRGGNPWGGR